MQQTWINIYIGDGCTCDFFDLGLPTPTLVKFWNVGYSIAYRLEGNFVSKKSLAYLGDVTARLLYLFKDCKPELLDFVPTIDNTCHYLDRTYKLSELEQRIPLLPYSIRPKDVITSFKDQLFEYMRAHAINLIVAQKTFAPTQLQAYGMSILNQFPNKTNYDVKIKSKAIYQYFKAKQFNIGWSKDKKREYMCEYMRKKRATQKLGKMVCNDGAKKI